MNSFGFCKIRAFSPQVKIADPVYNATRIIEAVKEAAEEGVECLVFPELSVTGYTCADLFDQEVLMKDTERQTGRIAEETSGYDIIFAIGAPVRVSGRRYNCAILIYKGVILGIVPKTYLPNYGEFYEKRWFSSGKGSKGETTRYCGQEIPFGTDLIFNYGETSIGIEICEDLWVPNPPSSRMAMAGANVILNLSASDDLIGKHEYLLSLISQQSARCRCVYAYASAGWGESSTDLVFSGKAIIADDGKVYESGEKFKTGSISETRTVDLNKLKNDRAKFNSFFENSDQKSNYRYIEVKKAETHKKADLTEIEVDPYPFVPNNKSNLDERCEEIFNIQSFGLMKRLDAIGCRKAVVGISGGLDSTLALLVTTRAFDNLGLPREGIIGVTMPGLATTTRTRSNAKDLMKALGVTSIEIPIGKAVEQHFKDIGQDPNKFDVTYENSQARERTQILMDVSNKEGGIVIGTGDMSELALGWCTYNGDQMSMYGVNASVPKTLVRHLVEWVASHSDYETSRILKDICDTPISPELIPADKDVIGQKTEDLVGPYELHDFYLYHFLRNSFEPRKIFYLAVKAFSGKYDERTILKWLKTFIKRFFSQQFKRSCMPDGPKVGSVNLSPRGDWRMPSDAACNIWIKELDTLEQEILSQN